MASSARQTVVVAIFGTRGSGKDVLARAYVRQGYAHLKFAAPLKDAVQRLFGFTDAQVHGAPELGQTGDPRELPSAWGPSPRRVLQFVGTELFQHGLAKLLPGVGRDFWARSLVESVKLAGHDRVVVSDMRFPHELEALRAEGWTVRAVRVRRAGGLREDDDASLHASETELDAILPDAVVENDGVSPMECPTE